MKITNWNHRPVVNNAKLLPFQKGKLPSGEWCPRGSGLSYGDASLAHQMLDMRAHKPIIELDGNLLKISAGFTVRDILNFCVPKGSILPVIPGTQHVTVGGMIAADVHGKNHEQNGSIGRWIESLELQLDNGDIIRCSPTESEELFKTTIGGIGLTGVILTANIKLIPLTNYNFKQTVRSFDNLEELLNELWNSTSSYKVGWCNFQTEKDFILIENEPLNSNGNLETFRLKKPTINIPFRTINFVRQGLMKIYNKRFAKQVLKSNGETIALDNVFFPLNSIGKWNRLYGTMGFYQLQFSFDREEILPKLESIFRTIRSSEHLPVLFVVKKHGTLESPGIISYPKPGFSFAMDFIYKKGIESTLIELNKQVAELGGRVYLAKDALLSAETFEKMYPESEVFKKNICKYNSGNIASLMSKRLNLTS